MSEYLVYRIKDDQFVDAPIIIVADDDSDAAEQAKHLAKQYDVELWDGPRFVRGIKSTDK
jgi:hypothetical protein